MKKIIEVSYPRSGSTLLMYYIFHLLEVANSDKSCCYNYGSCQTVPCTCASPARISKTHDYAFTENYIPLTINEDYIYIINLRKNKIKNVEAYLRWYIDLEQDNKPELDKKKVIINDDIILNYCAFIKMAMNYYDIFYDKYINNLSKKHENIFIVWQEDLEDNPHNVLTNLSKILDLDFGENKQIIIDNIIKSNRPVFKKSDQKYFDYIEKKFNEIVDSL